MNTLRLPLHLSRQRRMDFPRASSTCTTASSHDLRPEIRNSPAPFETERERLRILLVDNEKSTTDILGVTLQSAGYNVYPASTGDEALRRFRGARPDLVLLELRLPDMDGKQVLRCLREWTTMPIIMMSARHEEEEKIACLDIGADDYITKPFIIGELLARLRAALRRAFGIPRSEVFTAGVLKMDFVRREVMVGSQGVRLTATEYDLLKVLAIHAGSVRTHDQLIHEVWGATRHRDAVHVLRVTVGNLRRKLMADSAMLCPIVTEAGVGYRLQPGSDGAQAREAL
jgi:two-component system KDP operon response regulator KdpE